MNEKTSKKKVIGIDLGTTNSVVSILEGATPVVIANAEGSRTTPSVVAYTANGEALVGLLAKRQTVINSENTFYSIKRFIGNKYDEVKSEIDRVSYNVLNENGKIKLFCPIINKSFSPEEISAAVLKKLATDAGRFLNDTITEAIITVPAYFNDSQRLATRDAGNIAGLNVLRILNEPTAAALAYGLEKKKNEVVLIFDLGGGTFDVSILEVGDEVFEVLSTSGDTHLGGDDFDQVIVKYIMDDFEQKEGINLYKDKQALQRIIEASEKAKVELSTLRTTRIHLPFIHVETTPPKHIDIELDRAKFEELSEKLFDRCTVPVAQALQDAKLSKNEIDEIILVGGSTRIPEVRARLKSLLGKELNETVNPDEVVAMGAAIQAGILGGEITDLILLDVTPLSLGVETAGGLMTTVIPRNSSVPIKRTEMFSTAADNQEIVEVHVLQGERRFAKDNKSLGIFQLSGIPREPRGVPQISVTFQLDVNGLLSVYANELTSGIEQSIKIEGASVLDRDQVEKLIKEAEASALNDKAEKALVSITYEMDTLFNLCEEIQSEYSLATIDLDVNDYFNYAFEQVKYDFKHYEFINLFQESLPELEEALEVYIETYIINQIKNSSVSSDSNVNNNDNNDNNDMNDIIIE
jgi:molecular chaperone DnaK